MEKPYRMLGKRIRFFREQAGLTQSQLAEKIEASDNYIGLIERGIKQPSLDTITRIAETLEVRINELFEEVISSEDTTKSTQELKRLLNKHNFKDAHLLLSIYKNICEHRK
ncbi:MAG: helix-turn-helix transcriptional regulator [Candidatus Omnitrophica bacterium]|nr:helix-turn-helix transcriptional regulator [Candidatus Omnitrophota bacterium]